MKKANKSDISRFNQVTKKINFLISSGKWERITPFEKNNLRLKLHYYFNKLKVYFSRRKLARTLGAASILISSQGISQNFIGPDTNAFNIKPIETYLRKVDFADIDNDGDLDLFTNGYYGTIFFQENIGTNISPNFADTISNPFGINSAISSYALYSTLLTDLDNDGDFDILITSYNYLIGEPGTVSFFENIGTASAPNFGPEQVNPFGLMEDYHIISDAVDIDNDGDIDIISSKYDYYGDDGIIYFENIGTPSAPNFAAPVLNPFGFEISLSSYISFSDFSDLDLDGDLDMIRSEFYGNGVYYHENIGTASAPQFASGNGFGNPFNIPVFGADTYTGAPTFADIDSDGDQDLFILEYYGDTYFYENTQFNIGLEEINNDFQINLFPNPATQFIQIHTPSDITAIKQIKVLTLEGKVTSSITDNLKTLIDVNHLESGLYIVEIISADGQFSRSKFVKE
ncbi:MAG: T9SS type A sorting domain-containing protein [Crocinitomicaceae bacterium]